MSFQRSKSDLAELWDAEFSEQQQYETEPSRKESAQIIDTLFLEQQEKEQIVRDIIEDTIEKIITPRQIASTIIDGIIRKVIPSYEGPTRWFCPICSIFDDSNGVLDQDEVKRHIVYNHGFAILDINTSHYEHRVIKNLYLCKDCCTTFSCGKELIFHMSYSHNLLHSKAKAQRYDVMDYVPMPFDRTGKEIRYVYVYISVENYVNKSTLFF